MFTFVTLDHKTSHKGNFFEIEVYTSSESWINKYKYINKYLAKIQLFENLDWSAISIFIILYYYYYTIELAFISIFY